MSASPPVSRRAARAMREALKSSTLLNEALQTMLVRSLSADAGPEVTAAQINRVFPELRATFGGAVATAALGWQIDDDGQEVADALVGYPDEIPRSFWPRLGLTIHLRVATLHSATNMHYVDLHLLTSGRQDWFFCNWSTNVCGGEYAIGRPTSSTRVARRSEILDFAAQADGWLACPGHLTTSLSTDDLRWLREATDLPVEHRRSSLLHL